MPDVKTRKSHLERAKERNSEWWAFYRLKANIRSRISVVFKRISVNKKTKTEEIMGCTFLELKKHIEPKFKEGMDWCNYGLWHVDHIIPLSNAKTKEELISLCHYTNLQPLWAIDNMKKGNRYDPRTTS